MARRTRELFATIHTEGGLLPPELLKRIAEGDRELPGLAPEAYHLEKAERIGEAITRAWNRVRGAWEAFRAARAKLGEGAPDAGLTRDRWLLVLFQELGYGRLPAARGIEVDGERYPVSHVWHHTPIHLVGYRTELDRRTPGVAGAARRSPHSLVQELLNRSAEHQWGFLSNGLRLRLLRDNASLTRQAFIEFDLEAMLEGEVYADFALLFLLCHQSRVEAERPDSCWLEQWVAAARDQGTRALEHLRGGVQAAIEALGRGFLAHPRNGALREALRTGALDKQEYYRELLRLVYRLLFLLVAEDRGLLLDPDAKLDAKRRYLDHYSTARLRRLASRRRGGPHPDLWRSLRLVMAKLGDDAGCPDLALPPLGSFLWSSEAAPHLTDAELANEHLLAAVRALAFTEQGRLLRPVDWRNLDTEELGSVYESLLELHPEVDAGAPAFSLSTAAGHERKTTGSYYTPDSLVQCLLDTALDPVLDEAAKKPDPEASLLALTVCDPACGSGHFLIAAARRMARRLAQVRTGDAEPDPGALQHALRDVIGKCVYGVDVNPMAVELCKVSLWLEAIEPGRPLSFLDHQIQCGNSLLGTTPALLAKGIPDDAFEPIEGDDKKVASAFKKRNKAERSSAKQQTMFADFVRDGAPQYESLGHQAASLRNLADDTIAALHRKEAAFARLSASAAYARERLLADAWCAAFVWPKGPGAPDAPTSELFRRLGEDPAKVSAATRAEVERLAAAYRLFHWHLAFPEVFRVGERVPADGNGSGWSGGFDVVLSNPPWEHTELKEREFFSTRAPAIATATTGAERKRMIAHLEEEDPELFGDYAQAKRRHDADGFFAGSSGRYPLCGRGRINTYAVFAEVMRNLVSSTGRVGCIVPSGIATDDTTKFFFQDLTERASLVTLYDFENAKPLFPGVHRSYKFSLLTLAGSARPDVEGAEFAFFLHEPADLADPERRFRLSGADIALLNPNTHTCPVFRTRDDAELTKWIYRRVPVLVREGPPEENAWGVSFRQGLFNMTSDSNLFRTREQLEAEGWTLGGNIFAKGKVRMLPLYEAKMFHQFDHRWATCDDGDMRDCVLAEKTDSSRFAFSRFWVSEAECNQRGLGDVKWAFGSRGMAPSTNERTLIATVVPFGGFGNSIAVWRTAAAASLVSCLAADLSSLAADFIARQKVGGSNLNFFIVKQFAVLAPAGYSVRAGWSVESLEAWLSARVLELTYTARDLEPFAKDLGYAGPAFRWDDERRFLLRCELDAAFFHLRLGSLDEWKRKGSPELLAAFPTPRDAVAYIPDTFPIVRRKDEQTHGEYRTKRVILEIYDALQHAVDSGEPYATRLDPPPADPRVAHPPRRGA